MSLQKELAAYSSGSQGAGKSYPGSFNRQIVPSSSSIVSEAAKIEALTKDILYCKLGLKEHTEVQINEHPKIKNLNNFGKQIIIQMMRSSSDFKGFKVDIKEHILKSDVLFLIGTLCQDFDHMNTSPLFGYKVLDIGCGALSSYVPSEENEDLLVQFYNDHPPIGAEILQILGAEVIGIDPRENSKYKYEYQVSYKHKIMEFIEISNWLKTLENKFDVLTCFNLFNKHSFLYYYNSPKEISGFFSELRKAISPQGLLYTNAPVLAISPENKYINHKIFGKAGFKVLYEGYYYILQPA